MCQTTEETDVTEIDFRNLNPAQRHTKAFQIVGDLRAGESFVLVNNHDPKPLYDQLQAEHPDAFSWTYLVQGPSVWKVEIASSPRWPDPRRRSSSTAAVFVDKTDLPQGSFVDRAGGLTPPAPPF